MRCIVSFLILFVLFVLALEFSERDHINLFEWIFVVYALGFTLEKVAAMQEHGIKGQRSLTIFVHPAHGYETVYFKGTWVLAYS